MRVTDIASDTTHPDSWVVTFDDGAVAYCWGDQQHGYYGKVAKNGKHYAVSARRDHLIREAFAAK